MNILKRLLSGLVATFFIYTLVSPAVSARVQVSEFMADPDLIVLSDVRGEWVELENKDTVEVDLTDWELDINGTTHTFGGAGLTIAPGEFFVVCRIGALNGNVDCDYTWSGMPLLADNSTTTITLLDPSDTLTDEITYNADGDGDDVQHGAATQVVRDENGSVNYRPDTENVYYNPTINTPWGSFPLAEDTGTPGAQNPATPPAAVIEEVSPNDMNGWIHSKETLTSSGTYELQNDPTSPPRGTGSLQLSVPTGSDHSAFLNTDFNGTPLADIVGLSYATYRHSGDSAPAISLQFNFDDDLSDLDESWKGRLVYEPYHTQTVTDGVWQTWNTLTNSGSGNWWFTNGTLASDSGCTQSNPCTWQQVVAEFPEGGVHNTLGATILKAGSGWTNFIGNVDSLNIATAGSSSNPRNVIYDFEGDKVAPVVTIDADPASTTDRTPKLTGEVDDPAAAITVKISGQTHIATNNGDGTWTLPDNTISTLSTGDHTVTVIAEDVAGNQDTASRTITILLLPVLPTGPASEDNVTDENVTNNVVGVLPLFTASQASTSDQEKADVESETDETETSSTQTTNNDEDDSADSDGFNWWWLLLIIVVLGLLIAAARRRLADEE